MLTEVAKRAQAVLRYLDAIWYSKYRSSPEISTFPLLRFFFLLPFYRSSCCYCSFSQRREAELENGDGSRGRKLQKAPCQRARAFTSAEVRRGRFMLSVFPPTSAEQSPLTGPNLFLNFPCSHPRSDSRPKRMTLFLVVHFFWTKWFWYGVWLWGKVRDVVHRQGRAGRLGWWADDCVSSLLPAVHGIKWTCSNGNSSSGFSVEQLVQQILDSHQTKPPPRTHNCLCTGTLGKGQKGGLGCGREKPSERHGGSG